MRHPIREEDEDPKAQVRITDLRLAKDLEPQKLKSELKAEVSGLIPPVTVDKVLRWKSPQNLSSPSQSLYMDMGMVMIREKGVPRDGAMGGSIGSTSATKPVAVAVPLGL